LITFVGGPRTRRHGRASISTLASVNCASRSMSRPKVANTNELLKATPEKMRGEGVIPFDPTTGCLDRSRWRRAQRIGAIRGSGGLETLEQLNVREDRAVSEDETRRRLSLSAMLRRRPPAWFQWVSVLSPISTTSSSRKFVDSCLRRPVRFLYSVACWCLSSARLCERCWSKKGLSRSSTSK
jgi:hypothetical protein